MSLDVAALQKELDDLKKQRVEARQALSSHKKPWPVAEARYHDNNPRFGPGRPHQRHPFENDASGPAAFRDGNARAGPGPAHINNRDARDFMDSGPGPRREPMLNGPNRSSRSLHSRAAGRFDKDPGYEHGPIRPREGRGSVFDRLGNGAATLDRRQSSEHGASSLGDAHRSRDPTDRDGRVGRVSGHPDSSNGRMPPYDKGGRPRNRDGFDNSDMRDHSEHPYQHVGSRQAGSNPYDLYRSNRDMDGHGPRRIGIRSAAVVPTESQHAANDEQDNDPPVASSMVRRRVLSAVVAQNDHSTENGDGEAPSAGSKRPASDAALEDTSVRKRNRRMFGSLLGTLQKFREEDQRFQASDTAQRRAEMLKKAEERAREESERLRKQAAEQRAAQRRAEVERLMELNLAAEAKELEILYAKRIARKQALNQFMVTKTSPPLHWQPLTHNEATEASYAAQQIQFEEWKASVLAELEQEKQRLQQQAEARREAAERRRAAVAAARAASGVQAAGPAAHEGEGEGMEVEEEHGLGEEWHDEGAHDGQRQAEQQEEGEADFGVQRMEDDAELQRRGRHGDGLEDHMGEADGGGDGAAAARQQQAADGAAEDADHEHGGGGGEAGPAAASKSKDQEPLEQVDEMEEDEGPAGTARDAPATVEDLLS